jgi:Tfp pilus assembly protein PilX
MKTKRCQHQPRPAGDGQRGVSMLFALLTLVVLAFAGLALVRSVQMGSLVIGNVGFKQDALAYADQAAEDAITVVLTPNITGTTLDTHIPAQGYYATSYAGLDPTDSTPGNTARAVVDWDGNACTSYIANSYLGGCLTPKTSVSANGNSTQYIITRLCSSQLSATDVANICAAPLSTSTATSASRGGLDYQNNARFAPNASGAYFRIIVRTSGPRSTAAYTETIVHY